MRHLGRIKSTTYRCSNETRKNPRNNNPKLRLMGRGVLLPKGFEDTAHILPTHPHQIHQIKKAAKGQLPKRVNHEVERKYHE